MLLAPGRVVECSIFVDKENRYILSAACYACNIYKCGDWIIDKIHSVIQTVP